MLKFNPCWKIPELNFVAGCCSVNVRFMALRTQPSKSCCARSGSGAIQVPENKYAFSWQGFEERYSSGVNPSLLIGMRGLPGLRISIRHRRAFQLISSGVASRLMQSFSATSAPCQERTLLTSNILVWEKPQNGRQEATSISFLICRYSQAVKDGWHCQTVKLCSSEEVVLHRQLQARILI